MTKRVATKKPLKAETAKRNEARFLSALEAPVPPKGTMPGPWYCLECNRNVARIPPSCPLCGEPANYRRRALS